MSDFYLDIKTSAGSEPGDDRVTPTIEVSKLVCVPLATAALSCGACDMSSECPSHATKCTSIDTLCD